MFKILPLLLFILTPLLAQPTPPPPADIIPLVPVSVQLNNQIPALSYTFETEAGLQWSFTAVSSIGDVDPVLRLYDPDGAELLANDNETPDSLNARLEGWIASAAGEYRIEVSRAGGTRARTGGRVNLLLIPGFSNLISSQAVDLLPRGELALGTVTGEPVAITMTLDFTGEVWLRANPGWLLRLTPAGWSLHELTELLSDETRITGEEVDLPTGTYTLYIEGRTLRLTRNGDDLSTVTLDSFPLISAAGTRLSLVAPGNNIVTGQAALTTRYYTDPTVAMPPTPPGERLYDHEQDPIRAVSELEELGLVETGGGLLMTLPRGLIETQYAGFSTYPLIMGADLQDFVMSFDAQFRATSPGAACGMNFRVVDSDDFGSILFSEDGNVYLLEYEAGALTATSTALATERLNPGSNIYNHVLLIGRGETITLYVNGWYVGSTTMQPRAGVMQIALVLNEDTYTLCTLDNIWVWRLNPESQSQ